MSASITVGDNLKIQYVSVVDYDDFYKKIVRWFELKGYSFREVEYRDIEDAKGKSFEIIWEATNNVDDYAKFVIKMETMALGFQKLEMEKDGKKIKTNKANFTIKIDSKIIMDYQDQFGNGFKKILREMYDKYIIPSRISNYKQSLEDDTNELMAEIKSFFAMFGAAVSQSY